MRKITSLFLMLLAILSVQRVNAQYLEDYGMVPLISDSLQFSSPYSESTANEGPTCVLASLIDQDPSTYWHTKWTGTASANDPHWLQIEFTEAISGNMVLFMQRRNAANDHPTKFAITGSTDGETWSLVDTLEIGYSGAATSEVSRAWKISEPVNYLRFTVVDCRPTYRVYWHAAEFQLYRAEGEGLVAYMFNNILTQYDGYLPGNGSEFDLGTNPGQYSNVEAWEAFQKDLVYVNDYLNGEVVDLLTVEQAEEIIARIQANYQAILDSKVGLTPYANGYYFFATGLQYTNSTSTPVVDENGEPVLDPETGEQMVETTTTYPTKAMYTDGNKLMWKTLDETDINFLFRIDHNEETGNYKMYSCATDGRVDTVAQSTQVTVDETLDPVESEIAFNYSSKSEEHGYIITMARADQNSGYTLLHQGGHGGGVNNSGNIVGWEAAADASTWYLIPVEEAVAEKMIEDYAPIRDRDAMLASVAEMATSGSNMLDIARDLQTVEVNMEMPLISEPTQFSSPMTTTDTQCPTIEEVYPYLLDGNTTTYWHSRWEDGDRPNGTHYLQVELTEPEAVTGAAIQFTRRAVANDHVIEWGVYGTNDPEAEKGACEKLGVLATPFTSNTETILTGGFETKGYKYIRFYINNTTTGRGYGHVSEFQMYAATVAANPTSQMVMLGELSTNLQAAIAAIPAEQENITTEHYTALKAAYEAFSAKFVDPTALRAAIASAENAAKNVVIGNQPGFWSEGATDEFDAVMAEVKAYDKGGVYETAKSEEWIAGLDAAVKALYGKANQISTDKWYYMHYATEEMFDEYNWSKSGATDETSGMGNLFGQYVTAGRREAPEGDNNDYIEAMNGEDVREGTPMYYTEFTGEAGSMFRFIAVGDTAYVIQNKATGLYINCAARNNNNVTLSLVPTTFKVSAIGMGQNLIAGMSLSGTDVTNLHAQRVDHRLVTWEANTPGSNSGMMIVEAEDVDGLNNTIVRDVRPGKIYAQCYPVAVGTEEGMYTVAGTFTENEKNYLALNAIEKAEAGEPYIYIYGETTDYAEPAEGEEAVTEEVEFTFGNEVVSEAKTVNGLVGTFAYQWVDKGTPVFVNNGVEGATGEENTDCTRDVSANTAYVLFGQTTVDAAGTYSLVLEISGDVTAVSIQETLDNVAKSGAVYDLNGRLVKKNATLNDVKGLGRGIYILNGVKVMVK